MAEAVWGSVSVEHNVAVDGTLSNPAGQTPSQFYFAEAPTGHYHSRAVLADLEPEPIDSLKGMKVFAEELKVKGMDAAGFCSRGVYTIGKEKKDDIMQAICRAVDQCDDFQGFILYCSLLGGTGSGLTYLLRSTLQVEYPKKTIVLVAVFPSVTSNIVVEPLNFFMCAPLFIEGDLTIAINNDGLYKAAETESPDFTVANEAVAQVSSLLLSPQTHESWHHMDLTILQASLVKFPRISAVLPSLSPMRRSEDNQQRRLFDVASSKPEVLFQSTALLNSTQPLTCWDVEGRLTHTSQCFDVVTRMRPHWKDWQQSETSTLLLENTSLIVDCYERVATEWDELYSKRAFIHWYVGEGLESGEMSERREDIAALVRDYREMSSVIDPGGDEE